MARSIITHNQLPFVDNGHIKVFTVPVSIDMHQARKRIQNMLDRNNKAVFKFKARTNGN